ncbi:MAG: 3-deoxy-D-manno-octulosonic-acid transferase [candidate division TM6 bacterium GW2011_GWF2_38_10]|nr:MAG: 3-deoxy-D-manno-octulosonic-acid transferase [candidate division TM6 bacterium GW2011_GWF2_38_10]
MGLESPARVLQDALFKALDTNDCLVVQRLGVLFFLYSYASVYYLGGTFVPIGGHNMLEPAIWALPCVSGPHLHKCAAIAPELRAAGGLLIANTPNELGSHLVAYLATKKYIPTGLANYDILKQKAHNVDPVIHTIIE